MIISDTRRFVFFHVPKTGGTSMMAALAAHATPSQWAKTRTKHDTPASFMANNAERLEQRGLGGTGLEGMARDGWFRFAFVRNPWDRFVSLFAYLHTLPSAKFPELAGVDGFSDFVRRAERGDAWIVGLHSYRPQSDFLVDGDGVPALDFIGRFERLNEDTAAVGERLGLSIALEHLNPSRHDDYRDAYDAETRAAVGRLYQADIERLGYSF